MGSSDLLITYAFDFQRFERGSPTATRSNHTDISCSGVQKRGNSFDIDARPARRQDQSCTVVYVDMLMEFIHCDRIICICTGNNLGRAKLGAVIGYSHAKAKPFCQMRDSLAHVASADDDKQWGRADRIHKDIHLTTTHAGVAARRVSHAI